jgi:UDP-glucuronate 4-epimerase
MIGFYNILEYVRNNNIKKLLYASSSSVYGLSTKENFNENDDTDNPISLYAATKKSNELLAHSYSHLYNIGTVGLRFFTVYGPWGRPDMALFSFVRSILNGQEIEIYNHGKMTRDFTYIDDISNAVAKIAELDFSKIVHNTINKNKNFSIYNIGNSQPRSLMEYVEALESKIGITAKKKYLPIQLGDVLRTSSCTKLLNQLIDYKPSTDIEQGISHFVDWYCDYYESNYPGR